MKLARLIPILLFFSTSCFSEESGEYYMPPLKFIFSEEEDGAMKDCHEASSYWSMYNGICTVCVYLEQALPDDELSLFLSGVVIHIASSIDDHIANNVDVRLSFSKNKFTSDILKQSNLSKVERIFGKYHVELLKSLSESHAVFSEWDKDQEKHILKMSIPKESSEYIYKRAFVYAMNAINTYTNEYSGKSGPLQSDDVQQSIIEDAAIACRVLSLRMLIRAPVNPELFTREEEKIVFYSIRNIKIIELKNLIERYPTNVVYPINTYCTYTCPTDWKDFITRMDYTQLLQHLSDKLDLVFPERKEISYD